MGSTICKRKTQHQQDREIYLLSCHCRPRPRFRQFRRSSVALQRQFQRYVKLIFLILLSIGDLASPSGGKNGGGGNAVGRRASTVHATTLDIYKNARLGHRIVQTRYGRLHGLILPLDNFRFLRSVEVFLGVPYATPPIKQNRFSPTRAPAPWDGIRISDKYSPVCPQRLPNIQNETAALEKMPKGRLEYLKRLIPFLENQSEDCLYLNIFSPINAGANEKKLPVIVFIHGESFEWSSGNPYDGSVLASYGEVVVVTFNYRLGILGFLNANPNPQQHARVANYGLMDQMAALHWIQQNIQKFGGDAMAVTLAGHGTGAACINYLMTSPTMVRGLFRRAILMSGSAFSSWALVEDPVLFAVKLAKELNCSIPDDLNKHHEEIVDCLREVPLEDLYAVDIQAPTFLTSFGPSVDGVVIRSGHFKIDNDDLISRGSFRRYSYDGGGNSGSGSSAFSGNGKDDSNNGDGGGAGGVGGGSGGYFNYGGGGGGGGGSSGYGSSSGSHYDVLFGVVTGESIWRFSAQDVQNGFEGERRDKIIRTYVRNAYNYHLNEIFYTIVNEYTDWDRASQHPINTRDTAVAAISDAQFVAPIVRTGDIMSIHSSPHGSTGGQSSGGGSGHGGASASASASTSSDTAQSGRCYFYVFDYQTKDGDYPQRMGTVHGEDLPYIFGAPLVDGFSHFPQNYTKSEIALSEAMIIFWTNFAKTGNPNEHHRQDSILPVAKERNRFRSINWENYDPLHQKYLEIGMKPRIKNHFRAHQLSIWLRLIPELHRAGMEDVIARHNIFKNHDNLDLYEGPVKPDQFSSNRLLLKDDSLLKKGLVNATGASYMTSVLGVTTIEPNMFTTCIPTGHNFTGSGAVSSSGGGGGGGGVFLANASSDTLASSYESAGYAAYSTALSVTIAIGCSLLILNVLIFAGVYYQRDKTRLEVKSLQKQYQQRNIHQQVPYAPPPDTIKHAHYHMGHSQSANVIVDVENHHADQATTAMLMAAAGDVKQPPPPPHICGNSGMQMTMGGSQQQQQQQQQQHQQQQQQQHGCNNSSVVMTSKSSLLNSIGGIDCSNSGSGGNLSNVVTYSTSAKVQQQQQQHQQQQQQQQRRELIQIKGVSGNPNISMSTNPQSFIRPSSSGVGTMGAGDAGAGGSSSGGGGGGAPCGILSPSNYANSNLGMTTLPKANTMHHANTMNYNRNPGSVTIPTTGTVVLGSRGNVILSSMVAVASAGEPNAGGGDTDCMTRHHSSSSDAPYQQMPQQTTLKHQLNGSIINGVGGVGGVVGQHIRGPRPPIRTASSTPSSNAITQDNLLLDQTLSNGSSSSGVSSATSVKAHPHYSHHKHSHGDGSGSGGGGGGGGGGGSQQQLHPLSSNSQQQQQPQQQQKMPQAAIEEMRV